ncbi:TIGR03621 family F420-dependent LLM class oxidoreductase [Jatrophihabitans sp.]|uniref:TIGR03621 family F420-dependent LLM class oxidoreductase n=1 Tax=Jatrophihabitans sp. TaxID=1932789 RepID=UPI0030C6C8CC|nr:luciferase family protein [Jatrophihabitans sp.]
MSPRSGPARRPFRFGVQAFEATGLRDWSETARRAESLGYSALTATDHYFGSGDIATRTGHRPIQLAPLTSMAMAAAATSTLRVGCRVFCVDYHHPVVLGKELATLDLLSGGRVEAGLGAGWLQAEYEGLGIIMERPGLRIERLAEVAQLMRAQWSGQQIGYTGQHFQVSGFAGIPMPARAGGPPILIGGGSRRVLGLAGRYADIVSVNFAQASATMRGSVADSAHVSTTTRVEWIREAAGERFGSIELEVGAYFTRVTDKPTESLERVAAQLGVRPKSLADSPHVLIGAQSEIIQLLQQQRDTHGLSYISVPVAVMEEFAPVVSALSGT